MIVWSRYSKILTWLGYVYICSWRKTMVNVSHWFLHDKQGVDDRIKDPINCNLQSCLYPIPLGGVVPGLGLQTDPLNPLKPIPLGRAMAREQESPTAACTFPQTSSPTLQGISMPLMGGMMGADGLTAQGVRSQNNFHYLLSASCICVQLSAQVLIRGFFCYEKNESPFPPLSGLHTRRPSERCEPPPGCLPQC